MKQRQARKNEHKIRIFVQDVGQDGYSGYRDYASLEEAERAAATLLQGWIRSVLLLPHDRRDLWPNGLTGAVPEGALNYRRPLSRPRPGEGQS